MTIRAFGRLRVGNGTPVVSPAATNAIKTGELVASRQGKLYLGIGAGTGTNATSIVEFSGTNTLSPTTELGGLIYSDEDARSGSTYLLLSAPTTLTLVGMSHKTGAGTCSVQVRSGGTTYAPTASVTNAIGRTTFTGTVVGRQVQRGQPIELVISNANDLSSLIVQLDWLEG